MSGLHIERWGIGTDEHCYFGLVSGVFYVWRIGVHLRLQGGWPPLRVEHWPDGVYMLRVWPFIFLWVE